MVGAEPVSTLHGTLRFIAKKGEQSIVGGERWRQNLGDLGDLASFYVKESRLQIVQRDSK